MLDADGINLGPDPDGMLADVSLTRTPSWSCRWPMSGGPGFLLCSAAPPRAGMDHHTDPALGQSHVPGHGRVVDPVHGLHFEEVVARAQAADLRKPAFERPVADRGRVGSFQNAAVFAPLYVRVRRRDLVPPRTGRRRPAPASERRGSAAATRLWCPPRVVSRHLGDPSPRGSGAAADLGPAHDSPAAAPHTKCRSRHRRGRRPRRRRCRWPPRRRSETRIPSARRASRRTPARFLAASPRWPPGPAPYPRVRRAAAISTRTRSPVRASRPLVLSGTGTGFP